MGFIAPFLTDSLSSTPHPAPRTPPPRTTPRTPPPRTMHHAPRTTHHAVLLRDRGARMLIGAYNPMCWPGFGFRKSGTRPRRGSGNSRNTSASRRQKSVARLGSLVRPPVRQRCFATVVLYFSRSSQLCTTPHVPCDVLHLRSTKHACMGYQACMHGGTVSG